MKRTILFVTMALFSSAIFAQEVRHFSLEDAVGHAFEHNPALRKTVIDEQIAKNQRQEAVGGYLPQISGNAQYTDNFAIPQQQLPGAILGQPEKETVPVAFGVRYGVQATLQASQVIYNQQLITGLKSAAELTELYEVNTLAQKEQTAFDVAQAYLNIQVTQQQKELVRANLERVERLYKTTEEQLESGIVKANDLKQISVNKVNLQAQLSEVDYQLEQAHNLLKFYMNVPIADSIVLTEDMTERPDISSPLAMESNPSYRQIQQQIKLNEIQADAARAEYVPSLSAFFNYGYQGQTNNFQFSGEGYNGFNTGAWGLQLNVPLFDGFQRRNRLQNANLKVRQALQDQEQVERSVNMNYQNALRRVQLSEKQLEAQKENMEVAEDLYESTRESYKLGVAALSELLDAETALQEAQGSYLSNLLQEKLAQLEQLRASGQLAQLIEQNS